MRKFEVGSKFSFQHHNGILQHWVVVALVDEGYVCCERSTYEVGTFLYTEEMSMTQE